MLSVEPRRQQVWTLRIDDDIWSCDLTFRGESLGWEVRTLREGNLFVSRRFPVKAQATEWAAEMHGLLQCYATIGDEADFYTPIGRA